MSLQNFIHSNHLSNKSYCRAQYKLFNNKHLFQYIEDYIVNKKWLHIAVIDRAKVLDLSFNISIPVKSIYNYTDRNKLNITHFLLRFKLRREKTKKQYVKYTNSRTRKQKFASTLYIPILLLQKGWVRSFNGII